MIEAGPPFELFGAAHWWTIVVTTAIAFAVPLGARRLPQRDARRIALVLAVALVVYRTGWAVHRVMDYGDRVADVLPLGICPILFYLCAWLLWRGGQGVYEVAYYWAIGGTYQAMITPDVRFGFPHGEYLSFFASHGVLVLAVLYATLVFRMRPRWSSIPRVVGVTVLYAAVLIPINSLLGTNHMYVNHKPVTASLLDYLGPWPWYNVTAIGVAAVCFGLAYLPFLLHDVARDRRRAVPALD